MRSISTFLVLLFVAAMPAASMSWNDYAALLGERVNERGLVDYAGMKAEPGRLDAVVATLAAVENADYVSWSEPEKIAFWVNAYNALTLKLIVDHYPIQSSLVKRLVFPASSIRQIAGAWDEITFTVMGEEMTLDHIEHGILRAQFDEPRIHAALVCAALSCPPLRNEPYRGSALDEQLTDQMQRFLARPDGLAVDADRGVVRLSAIFDWFKGDFVKQYQGGAPGDRDTAAVLDFVGRYAGDEVRRKLQSGDFEIKHFDYDWTLNEQTP